MTYYYWEARIGWRAFVGNSILASHNEKLADLLAFRALDSRMLAHVVLRLNPRDKS
jgi:hypothetical protein